MIAEFQDSLLKYLFQDKAAKKYKDYLDKSVFDIPTMQIVFDFWQDYVTKYNSIPPKANFLEYVDRLVKRSKGAVTHEVYNEILNTIAGVYAASTDEYDFTREIIIDFAKKKGMRNLFTSNADKIKNATAADLDNMYNQMRHIVQIGSDSEEIEKNRGGFLFRDGGRYNGSAVSYGHPTFLQGLNRMTAAGGFYSPQHILFMGGPKAFKTGLLICLLIEYARSGLNVFVADAENGLNSYRTRIKQGLLECERHEVSSYTQELIVMLKRIKKFGGDIFTHFFPSGSTLDDVDTELTRLAVEENWTPNLIVYDPLYLFAPVNKKIYEARLKIQEVNRHAVRLNNKYGTFSFTATKVKADAVNKLVLKKNDLGEDFTQNYDAHAIFALCRTESEEANGYGRIVPVSQREGIGYRPGPLGTCAIKIDDLRNTVTELDSEAYLATLEDEYAARQPKGNNRRKYIPTDKLKDE